MLLPQLRFLLAALKNPREVSTIFQTMPWLRDHMMDSIDFSKIERLVELGAGAGAITAGIADRLQKPEQYLGIELDHDLIEVLRERFPQLKFAEASAENVHDLTQASGPVDVIVSSLPWTLFPPEMREHTMKNIADSLKPGGMFMTYMVVNAIFYPSAQDVIRQMKINFSRVEQSKLFWKNFPPAFVFTAYK